jgi:hypothetical protein
MWCRPWRCFTVVAAAAGNPNIAVGEDCQKDDLDTAMGKGARRLDLKAARILSEAVAATWKVHRL